jgi:hypothetical protein
MSAAELHPPKHCAQAIAAAESPRVERNSFLFMEDPRLLR